MSRNSNAFMIQALCVCDNTSIDMVLGRLAHCGVGNIIGSVNVVSLESSMFSKASTDMLKEDLPIAGTEDSTGIDGMNVLSKDDESDDEEEQRKLFMETASQLRVEQVVEQIKVGQLSMCTACNIVTDKWILLLGSRYAHV